MTVHTLPSNGSQRHEHLFPPDLIENTPKRQPVALLSHAERERLMERAFAGLYRWYVARSQKMRNWNPDADFAWGELRQDHSPDVIQLIEGFFAVEQYTPDYTSEILQIVRRSNGRSNFQLRWGAEEERHANTWENALLFSRGRSPGSNRALQVAAAQQQLDAALGRPAAHDAVHGLSGAGDPDQLSELRQDRARRVGQPAYANDADPVLARACTLLAVDEAAHYAFFLEGARLYLYYQPEETLQGYPRCHHAFRDARPEHHSELAAGRRDHLPRGRLRPARYSSATSSRPVFENMTVTGRKALENGLKRSREIPNDEGVMRLTALWDAFDPGEAERSVMRLHDKIIDYEKSVGRELWTRSASSRNPDWPKLRDNHAHFPRNLIAAGRSCPGRILVRLPVIPAGPGLHPRRLRAFRPP